MENPADVIFIAFKLSLGEAGRGDAMTRIWEVYGRGIFYYITRTLSGDKSRCDDCFQETMLKVYNGLEGFSLNRPLKPWIYRIAHNCCRDYIRQRRGDAADDSVLFSAAGGRNHEDEYERKELSSAIDKSISRLNIEDMQISYLRFYEGLKFREIAAVMNLNENSVKTRMEVIKRKLRDDLRGWL